MCVKRLLAKKTWSFSFLVILKRCKKAWQASELKTPLHFLGSECFVNQGWYKFIVCMEECMADITNDFHGVHSKKSVFFLISFCTSQDHWHDMTISLSLLWMTLLPNSFGNMKEEQKFVKRKCRSHWHWLNISVQDSIMCKEMKSFGSGCWSRKHNIKTTQESYRLITFFRDEN